jgi:hypothetical protein
MKTARNIDLSGLSEARAMLHPYQDTHNKLTAMLNQAGRKYRIPDIEAARKIKRIERRQAELRKEIAVLMQGTARGGSR